jgi:hypothetical protein
MLHVDDADVHTWRLMAQLEQQHTVANKDRAATSPQDRPLASLSMSR